MFTERDLSGDTLTNVLLLINFLKPRRVITTNHWHDSYQRIHLKFVTHDYWVWIQIHCALEQGQNAFRSVGLVCNAINYVAVTKKFK